MLLLCATACARPTVKETEPSKLYFALATAATAEAVIRTGAPPGLDPEEEEKILDAHCRPAPIKLAVEVTTLAIVVDAVVGLILDAIGNRLKEQVQQYSSTYTGSLDTVFYSDADGLQTDFTCLRFARLTRKGGATKSFSGSEVELDFIASIGLSPARDVIVISPLRLYMRKGVPKSDDNKFGVAIGLAADSVWRDGNEGYSKTVFDEVILTETVDLGLGVGTEGSSPPFLRYYMDEEAAKEVVLPIIPVSRFADAAVRTECPRPEPPEGAAKPATRIGDAEGPGDLGMAVPTCSGRVGLRLAVAEVGSPPEWLEALIAVFDKAKDDLAGLLAEAAKKKLDLDEE